MSEEPDRVVIRDKRRIDPVTGEARHPDDSDKAKLFGPDPESRARSDAAAQPADVDVPKAQALLLEERTRDLQRLQAEYANYRKRVDRDRVAISEQAVGRVLASLLPVLDDIDRAREHGDLTGALKAVADQLDSVLAKQGLVTFGEVGDPFDPSVHEAVLHAESDDVDRPTATTVMRRGYRHGERLLRPAMVGVTDPAPPAEPAEAGD
jgi:molecular chaperone GrpE